jgi:hypothetical protein
MFVTPGIAIGKPQDEVGVMPMYVCIACHLPFGEEIEAREPQADASEPVSTEAEVADDSAPKSTDEPSDNLLVFPGFQKKQ